VKVIDLGAARDFLRDWDAVRQRILSGTVAGFALTVRDQRGSEAIYLGGHFKRCSQAALKAGMRSSWEMSKREDLEEQDEVPITDFRVSQL
jgi:hypothetical protein